MAEVKNNNKILFVLPQLNTGGTERIVLELAKKLEKLFVRTYIISFRGGALEREFRKTCQGVYKVPKKKSIDFNTMWEIAKIIKRKNIQIVNAHHYMPFLYSYMGSIISNAQNIIYTEHSVAEVELIHGIYKPILGILLNWKTLIVGVSNEITHTFKEMFPSKRKIIKCIPNGLEIERFARAINKEEVRAELGLAIDHMVIGNVANFRTVKNHLCLIKAFNVVIKRLPNVRLVIVGTGFPGDSENSEAECRRLIKSYGLENKVILTGYIENIPRILSGFDIFCLPSYSEGLPVSVLEAMAAKLPVVASNVRGIKEVVFHKQTGLLFPSNDSSALADSLEKLLTDTNLRNEIIENSFDWVIKNHALSGWVAKYLDLFDINYNVLNKQEIPIEAEYLNR